MSEEELKLKVAGLLSQEVPVREICERLELPYSKVLRFKKEYTAAIKASNIDKLVNTDTVVVERIANEFQEEIHELGIEGELMDIKKGIDGYQVLSTELQNTAVTIAKQIDRMAALGAGPSELSLLTEALAALQTAFFNKNVTQVNVLNAPGGDTFGGFKNRD